MAYSDCINWLPSIKCKYFPLTVSADDLKQQLLLIASSPEFGVSRRPFDTLCDEIYKLNLLVACFTRTCDKSFIISWLKLQMIALNCILYIYSSNSVCNICTKNGKSGDEIQSTYVYNRQTLVFFSKNKNSRF